MTKTIRQAELLKWADECLRYRGVMDLAFGGATDEEIGSISGHESKEMIRKYAGDARQIMLAKSANKKREA